MKIPKKVKVGGQTYKVREDRATVDFGSVNFQTLEIQIDASAAIGRREQSFLHEIIEAVNKEFDVELTHHQIELLEGGLYQVIVDNPTVFYRRSW
jgi:hypothetical protein